MNLLNTIFVFNSLKYINENTKRIFLEKVSDSSKLDNKNIDRHIIQSTLKIFSDNLQQKYKKNTNINLDFSSVLNIDLNNILVKIRDSNILKKFFTELIVGLIEKSIDNKEKSILYKVLHIFKDINIKNKTEVILFCTFKKEGILIIQNKEISNYTGIKNKENSNYTNIQNIKNNNYTGIKNIKNNYTDSIDDRENIKNYNYNDRENKEDIKNYNYTYRENNNFEPINNNTEDKLLDNIIFFMNKAIINEFESLDYGYNFDKETLFEIEKLYNCKCEDKALIIEKMPIFLDNTVKKSIEIKKKNLECQEKIKNLKEKIDEIKKNKKL